MADDDSESLRKFATIIQQKAAQPEPDRIQPSTAGANEPTSPGQATPQTVFAVRPRMVIAGIAASIGVAIGFLLGKLKR